MSIRVVLTLVLHDHAVDLGLFGVLSDQNALEVIRILVLFRRQRLFDLLNKGFLLGFADNCEALLSVIQDTKQVRAHGSF